MRHRGPGGTSDPKPPAKTSGDTMQMAGMADHAMTGVMDDNMMKHTDGKLQVKKNTDLESLAPDLRPLAPDI